MARLRIGVVGGGVAGLRHVTRLAMRDDVVVTGVADPAPERRLQVARLVDIPTFESAEQLVAVGRPDAVFVCVPPNGRGPVEELLLDNQTPMLLEKPIAADVDTAEHLAARFAASDVPVAVGYQWRQLSFLPEVRRALDGRVVNLVVVTWMCPPAATAWWGDVRTAGGQLVEQATHLIDLAIALNGDIQIVAGSGSAARVSGASTGFHKASTALLRFANGAAGSVTTTCVLAQPYRRSLELVADGVVTVITEDGGECETAAGRTIWNHEAPDLYVREHNSFLELAVDGVTTRPMATYNDALLAHRAACAMEAAMAAGASKPVPDL